MDKQVVIKEIQRVAKRFGAKSLSRGLFKKYGSISAGTVDKTFGCWNDGVIAAGLVPLPSGGLSAKHVRELEAGTRSSQVTDHDLLAALLSLAEVLGRRPSGNQLTAKGRYSPAYYIKRWGTVAAAYEAAIATQAPDKAARGNTTRPTRTRTSK